MNGWRRYPGRLAHRIDEVVDAIRDVPDDSGHRKIIGRKLSTVCGRQMSVFWTRPWSAEYVDFDDLRESNPRGWCLRCAYWTAREALILPRSVTFEGFVAMVYAGRYRLG